MREFTDEPERHIIGIVGDTRDGGLNADPQPKMYVPAAQLPDAVNALNVRISPMAWFIRTRISPTPAMTQQVQDALADVTRLPVSNTQRMGDIVSTSISRQRFNMWLMSIFGAAALLLAAVGIYGLMAYSVSQRTQEMGIRLALGAQAGQVRRLVVLSAMKLALIGIVLGLAAAFGLARYLTSFLFEVSARDPITFVGVPPILMLVAWFAVWLPARRASLLDPLDALRHE